MLFNCIVFFEAVVSVDAELDYIERCLFNIDNPLYMSMLDNKCLDWIKGNLEQYHMKLEDSSFTGI